MTLQEVENGPESASEASDPLLRGTSYVPSRESADRIRLQIPAAAENLQPVRDFVYRVCRGRGFSAMGAFDVKLIAGEALSNITKHAYRNQGGPIFIDIIFFKTFIELRFRDYGIRAESPRDMARDLSEYRETGLGLFVIQSLSDYHYFDRNAPSGTLLVMKKRIA